MPARPSRRTPNPPARNTRTPKTTGSARRKPASGRKAPPSAGRTRRPTRDRPPARRSSRSGPRTSTRNQRAGADVHLHIEAQQNGRPDTCDIHLAGQVTRPAGVKTDSFPRPRDLAAAARKLLRGHRPAAAARLLAAMAHPQRLTILATLLAGEATHRQLVKETGLKAGPLYHHLRELRQEGLIGPRIRDLYTLTPKGRRAFLAILAVERATR